MKKLLRSIRTHALKLPVWTRTICGVVIIILVIATFPIWMMILIGMAAWDAFMSDDLSI